MTLLLQVNAEKMGAHMKGLGSLKLIFASRTTRMDSVLALNLMIVRETVLLMMNLSHSANLMTVSLDAGTQWRKLKQASKLSAEIENLLCLIYTPIKCLQI